MRQGTTEEHAEENTADGDGKADDDWNNVEKKAQDHLTR